MEPIGLGRQGVAARSARRAESSSPPVGRGQHAKEALTTIVDRLNGQIYSPPGPLPGTIVANRREVLNVSAILELLRKLAASAQSGSALQAAGSESGPRTSDSVPRQAIDAILLEYDVQTRDRRLYAQSMFGTIGFVVAGTVALLAAATQANQPLTLLLIPPLLLAGGVLTVILRIHLLRVSVFLTVVEEDLRRRLGDATYPIVWETTMTGRTEAVTSWSSPARSSAGLSLTVMLVMGVGLATRFLVSVFSKGRLAIDRLYMLERNTAVGPELLQNIMGQSIEFGVNICTT